MNPSANVFVFGNFNLHHKDWLTYSGRLVDLVNSIIIFLSRMASCPTQILDYDSHSPALLDLFISSDASICSRMVFPPLGNSDHVAVSASIDFPSYSQRDASFHRIAYDYFRAD